MSSPLPLSSPAPFPPTHTLPPLPGYPHTHTAILLHGRGSTATEFSSDFFESQASDGRTLRETFPTIKWVFPSSALRPSARFGDQHSQWFDIWSVSEHWEWQELQMQGLRESVKYLGEVVRKEVEELGPRGTEKVVLGGISMGCATGLHVLLNGVVRLGGFLGLCGWLPLEMEISGYLKGEVDREGEREEMDEDERRLLRKIRGLVFDGEETTMACGGKLPSDATIQRGYGSSSETSPFHTAVFLGHSEDDEIVPMKNGEDMAQCLIRMGIDVELETYEDGAHWINEPEGVDDMIDFLRDRVGIVPAVVSRGEAE
ncbi:MAG: hypothetical protein MMC33_006214 [Icmadophila ericetorum]|nr:hypothetical protein [Icmadophila ericetorum]